MCIAMNGDQLSPGPVRGEHVQPQLRGPPGQGRPDVPGLAADRRRVRHRRRGRRPSTAARASRPSPRSGAADVAEPFTDLHEQGRPAACRERRHGPDRPGPLPQGDRQGRASPRRSSATGGSRRTARSRSRRFVLDQPGDGRPPDPARGDNFGAGSSREHAPWALTAWGIRAILSTCFADIFRSNASRTACCRSSSIRRPRAAVRARAGDPDAEFTVDLAEQGVLLRDGTTIDFDVDPFAKRMILAGTDELGYLLRRRPSSAPGRRRTRRGSTRWSAPARRSESERGQAGPAGRGCRSSGPRPGPPPTAPRRMQIAQPTNGVGPCWRWASTAARPMRNGRRANSGWGGSSGISEAVTGGGAVVGVMTRLTGAARAPIGRCREPARTHVHPDHRLTGTRQPGRSRHAPMRPPARAPRLAIVSSPARPATLVAGLACTTTGVGSALPGRFERPATQPRRGPRHRPANRPTHARHRRASCRRSGTARPSRRRRASSHPWPGQLGVHARACRGVRRGASTAATSTLTIAWTGGVEPCYGPRLDRRPARTRTAASRHHPPRGPRARSGGACIEIAEMKRTVVDLGDVAGARTGSSTAPAAHPRSR